MHRISEESIMDIIDRSEMISTDKVKDEKLKSILKMTMQELYRYNKGVFKSIEDKILATVEYGEIGEIVSALVIDENRNLDKTNFYGLADVCRPGSSGRFSL